MGIPENLLQNASLEKPAYEWPAPEPLTEQTAATPFPMDALPGVIGGAINEVVAIVRCPPALAANAALSVLATACQGVANVQPHNDLNPAPLSLYTLLIGESGERKTTADNFFSKVLNDWCEAKAQELEPELQAYEAELEAHKAQIKGVEKAITAASQRGDSGKVEEFRTNLVMLKQNEPAKVCAPDMLMEDTTPEAIAHDLMHKWPAAGILTSEAGSVFGGHGMKAESIAKNLATLNRAWESGSMKISRRTSNSFTVSGARVTMGLAVQPAIIRKYHEQNGESARGSGFFARFLLAWPASTIGTRLITVEEAQGSNTRHPQLDSFHARLREVLEQHYINGKGGKFDNLPVLRLSDNALAHWVQYCNDVETSMQTGGDMEEVKDIASKSADNAARLAGLFHIFNGGHVLDTITGETMQAACRLAGWYLYEARRFFGEIALPVADLEAVKLDSWLISQGESSISRSHVLQRSPIRAAGKLNSALDKLEATNRVRQTKESKTTIIEINPALLKGGE